MGASVFMELAVSACAGTGNLIWATLGSLLFPLYKSPGHQHRYGPAAGLVRLEDRKSLILNAVPEAIVSGAAFCLPGQFPAVQPSNCRMHKNNILITGA